MNEPESTKKRGWHAVMGALVTFFDVGQNFLGVSQDFLTSVKFFNFFLA